MTDAILLLALLVGLELVLGVDNVLVIAVFAARLPENLRRKRIMDPIVFSACLVSFTSCTRRIEAP